MALINKLFPRPFSSSQVLNTKSDSCLLPSKKQVARQREPIDDAFGKQQRNAQKACTQEETQCASNRRAAPIRLLLFRECEVRGRRLIFDSGGGDNQNDDFQEDQLINDMVFGSATLKYSGENYRFHDFGPSQWKGYEIMLTKVFLVPPVAAQPLKSDSRAAKDSGYMECESGSSLAASAIASARTSAASSIALAVTRPKPERNAVSDSLLANGNRNNGHSRSRKVRLAIALLFLPSDPSKEISVRDLIHEQFALIEHFIQRLQYGVIRAYWSRNNFHSVTREVLSHFERDLNDVLLFPRNADPPVYISMSRACADRQQVAERFMIDWDSVVSETDTKLTRFFWSSLLSAVLTYHVNWLHSYVSGPVEFRDCGTRVLVLSKDPALARRLLHVLSFFVRTSVVMEVVKLEGSPRPSPLSVEKNFEYDAISRSTDWLKGEARIESPVMRCLRNGSSFERRSNGSSGGRRGSQQLENTRYLRNYYDVRFQLSPDTIAKRDARPFANLMSSIAKNGFQDFYADELADSGVSESKAACAFFVGSAPDHLETPGDLNRLCSGDRRSESEPINVQISSLSVKSTRAKLSHLLRWSYGTGLEARYQAGRALQSCDPSRCDWLRELQTDLRAAAATTTTTSTTARVQGPSVSCVVANTDTWEVQVLTSTKDENCPELPRIKQTWVPVTMSGQVADLVESTQLLWSMLRNSEQCVEHVNNRLRLLCKKSEDLGAMLSASIQSWNVDRVTRLLGIEPPDLPLLMAACSVHSPVVSSMGGVTML